MAMQPVEVQTRTTNDWFGQFAARTSGWLGSKWGFSGAALIVAAWAVSGPLFRYSDGWQLVIKTGTNIIKTRRIETQERST